MAKMTLAALSGSLRAGSMSTQMRDTLPELAPDGMQVDCVDIHDVPLFNEDLRVEGVSPPAVARICNALAQADGIVICSPEHNRSVPGVLKMVTDWASTEKGAPLKGKPMVVLTQSSGARGGNLAHYAWRQILSVIGADVVVGPDVSIGLMQDKLQDGRVVDDRARDQIARQLDLLAARIELRRR
ncbi:NADPH-dependent FMN reductase [Pseudooceanicola algae]|uniref:Quinone reductase n=1 Tax=Pseudooceanicola algae TaxID=1537215 RepID=A0A418SB21_9RHOB|nr:NADPH-dependent FMN reductase [Pseudooceanicola algae]QPM91270.1 Quinone reductase [Pseudooceanicola algae]